MASGPQNSIFAASIVYDTGMRSVCPVRCGAGGAGHEGSNGLDEVLWRASPKWRL